MKSHSKLTVGTPYLASGENNPRGDGLIRRCAPPSPEGNVVNFGHRAMRASPLQMGSYIPVGALSRVAPALIARFLKLMTLPLGEGAERSEADEVVAHFVTRTPIMASLRQNVGHSHLHSSLSTLNHGIPTNSTLHTPNANAAAPSPIPHSSFPIPN